jgi:hypothetical protein
MNKPLNTSKSLPPCLCCLLASHQMPGLPGLRPFIALPPGRTTLDFILLSIGSSYHQSLPSI